MPEMTPQQYWKLRALSEQGRSESLQAELADVRAQLARIDARMTQAKLQPLLQEAGMLEGNWRGDDDQECFVRVDEPAPQ